MPQQEQNLAFYQTVAVNALREFVPKVWSVRCMPGQGDDPNCGIDNWNYASHVWFDRFTMRPALEEMPPQLRIPCVEGVFCLFVVLHEIGHVFYNHTMNRAPRSEEVEREASEWALAYMEEKGVVVPQEVKNKARLLWEHRGALFDRNDPQVADAISRTLGINEYRQAHNF